MIAIRHCIIDELGLHARSAGQLVKMAGKCTCKVSAEGDGKTVDAKSILGVMSLGLKHGAELVIRVDGAGEDEAARWFEEYLQSNV